MVLTVRRPDDLTVLPLRFPETLLLLLLFLGGATEPLRLEFVWVTLCVTVLVRREGVVTV